MRILPILVALFFCTLSYGNDRVMDSLYLELAISKTDLERAGHLNSIGSILSIRGEYEKGAEFLIKSIELFEQEGDSARLQTPYLNLGNVYAVLGQLDKGLFYMHKSRALAIAQDKPAHLATCLLNIGATHNLTEETDSALIYCRGAARIQHDLGDSISLIRTYTNIGYILEGIGYRDSALAYYKDALRLVEPQLNRHLQADVLMTVETSAEALYNNIGSSLVAMGEIDSGLFYLKKVIHFNSEFSSPYIKKFAYHTLSEIYESRGQFEKSLDYHKLYAVYSDSVRNIGQLESINEMSTKYEVEKRAGENAKLREQNETITHDLEIKDDKIRFGFTFALFTGIFSLSLIVFSIFLIKRNQLIRKLNGQLAKQNNELNTAKQKFELKALLNQINPHFIFNSLNSIQQFIVNNDSRSSFEYFSRFGNLIRASLEHSELSSIPIHEEIEVLKNYVTLENLRFKDDILLDIDTGKLDKYALKIPPMFIQPIVENSIIHGFSEKTGKKIIRIRFEDLDEFILCTVTDNGVGRIRTSQTTRKKSNSGLIITENRLKSIWMKADTDMMIIIRDLFDHNENPSGTKVLIKLPKSF